jgi:hypothetical protein
MKICKLATTVPSIISRAILSRFRCSPDDDNRIVVIPEAPLSMKKRHIIIL